MTQAHVNSPYRQPVIGWPEDVKNLSAENVKSWHDQWYHPNNATLVIVGDIKIQETKALVDKYFAAIPSKALPARIKNQEQENPGERHLELSHPQTTTPSFIMGFNVHIRLGFQGVSRTSPDYPALYVASHTFGGSGLTSILMEQLREKQGLVYGAY